MCNRHAIRANVNKGWSGLFYPPNGLNFQFCWFNLIFLIAPSWSESNFILFLFFHSIRVGPSRSEWEATRGECLPCERLVQGKRHVGKKSSASTRHFIALLRSQKLIWIFSIFASSSLAVWSPGMKSLTSGFGHIKITSNEPWNTETHKTDRNPPITNHKQRPYKPVEVNFRFLRGSLRWFASDIFLTRGSKCANHRMTTRDDLDIVWYEIFRSSSKKQFG